MATEKTPFFSIIIPTYNRAYCIGDTLQSAIDQKFKNYEIIVIDSDSRDNTEEVVKNFSDENIRYIKLTQSDGVNKSRNFGASIAYGTWLIFLDSDDVLSLDALTTLFQLTSSMDSDVIFTRCVNPSGNIVSQPDKFEGYINYSTLCSEKLGITEYTPMIKRITFLNNGGFFEDINGGEGITWKKILKAGHTLFISRKITRIYNNVPRQDRLSYKPDNFERLANVFKKDCYFFWSDYLRYKPLLLWKKILRYGVYRFCSLFRKGRLS